VRLQIQYDAGDARLGLGDANLPQQGVADRGDADGFIDEGRTGALNIEKDAVGVDEPFGVNLEFRGNFDGDAGDIAERPEADGRNFTRERPNRS
jgi:hypothetical protein